MERRFKSYTKNFTLTWRREADRLRGEESQPRQIGIGNAGIGGQHGEHGKLWRRYTQIGERPFHPVPVRPRSLPQQVAQITIFPEFALCGYRKSTAARFVFSTT